MLKSGEPDPVEPAKKTEPAGVDQLATKPGTTNVQKAAPSDGEKPPN
jgi:hypothetical protein